MLLRWAGYGLAIVAGFLGLLLAFIYIASEIHYRNFLAPLAFETPIPTDLAAPI